MKEIRTIMNAKELINRIKMNDHNTQPTPCEKQVEEPIEKPSARTDEKTNYSQFYIPYFQKRKTAEGVKVLSNDEISFRPLYTVYSVIVIRHWKNKIELFDCLEDASRYMNELMQAYERAHPQCQIYKEKKHVDDNGNERLNGRVYFDDYMQKKMTHFGIRAKQVYNKVA